MTKSWKKITAEKIIKFFGSKTTIYLSLGLHKERPRYRRSLQLSKKAIQHPNPDLDPLTRMNPDPIRIRIRNPESKTLDPDLVYWMYGTTIHGHTCLIP
jgi:hypothetical protein